MPQIRLRTVHFILLLFFSQMIISQTTMESYRLREEMRDFVIAIKNKAESRQENFIVIPQNGIELILKQKSKKLKKVKSYLGAIDGLAQEDLFFGYEDDGKPTPTRETNYFLRYLKIAQNRNKAVLGIDYTKSYSQIKLSNSLNKSQGFISFAAERELNKIPFRSIENENNEHIEALNDAKNFLYLLNFSEYSDKKDLLAELSATNYDVLILDLFFGDRAFSREDIKELKQKANGGKRLLIAYMSIGEAEDYRFYWQKEWEENRPVWLEEENPNWEGNYKVRYWNKAWQEIILGTGPSYLNRIIDAGFDGVYLDIIDAFQYFENKE